METVINTIVGLMKKTAISFLVCIMFICIIGSVMGEQLTPISSLFQEGSIRYSTLFEVFSLSFIIGIINTVFDYPQFMKKMLLLYKIILRLIIVILITIVYIYVFNWFPFSNLEAWIGFFVTFGICFTSAVSISVYTTRRKNREYQELLKDFKKRGQLDERH